MQALRRVVFSRATPAAVRRVGASRRVFASVPEGMSIRREGQEETLEYRMFYEKSNQTVSPWHDIPLFINETEGICNYVNEIPLHSRAKMEIATEEADNPIKQDIKKGALRYFTYGDIPFNYGALPRTWEDPTVSHPDTSYPGDNDPVDVVEMSPEPIAMGEVTPVKILGAMALIDEEETDWKILALRQSHPLADKINSPEDLDAHMPGSIAKVHEWFKMYKTTDGKPINSYAFDGAAKGKDYAMGVVAETHQSWQDLVDGKIDAGDLVVPGPK